eukprot:7908189-Alexandrium_andersonii.AAC.1
MEGAQEGAGGKEEGEATGEAGGESGNDAGKGKESRPAGQAQDAGEQELVDEVESKLHADITDYCKEYLEPAFAVRHEEQIEFR